MKRISFFLMASLFMTALSFTSCEKDETSPMAVTLAEDDEVFSFFDEIMSEADEVSMQDNVQKSTLIVSSGSSGTRTLVTTFSGDTVIHTITFVDFVNGNSPNGRVKNGTVVVKVVGRHFQPVFWREISFVDFTVNDNLVEGVKVIEKIGDYQYSINLTDGKITFTDGTSYTRDVNRIRTWVAGYDTPFFVWDDEFTLEGEAWGVNRQGNSYTHTITNPLIIKRSCRWIVQGTIEFVVGEQMATLDYGDGECDQFATLTVDGESWTINLRRRGN